MMKQGGGKWYQIEVISSWIYAEKYWEENVTWVLILLEIYFEWSMSFRKEPRDSSCRVIVARSGPARNKNWWHCYLAGLKLRNIFHIFAWLILESCQLGLGTKIKILTTYSYYSGREKNCATFYEVASLVLVWCWCLKMPVAIALVQNDEPEIVGISVFKEEKE